MHIPPSEITPYQGFRQYIIKANRPLFNHSRTYQTIDSVPRQRFASQGKGGVPKGLFYTVLGALAITWGFAGTAFYYLRKLPPPNPAAPHTEVSPTPSPTETATPAADLELNPETETVNPSPSPEATLQPGASATHLNGASPVKVVSQAGPVQVQARQGEVVRIDLPELEGKGGVVILKTDADDSGNTYPVSVDQNNVSHVMLPVGVYMEPGVHRISIQPSGGSEPGRVSSSTANAIDKGTLEVQAGDFSGLSPFQMKNAPKSGRSEMDDLLNKAIQFDLSLTPKGSGDLPTFSVPIPMTNAADMANYGQPVQFPGDDGKYEDYGVRRQSIVLLAPDKDAQVKAPFDGRVAWVSPVPPPGEAALNHGIVVIESTENPVVKFILADFGQISVKEGDSVIKGQTVIGTVSSGEGTQTTQPHVTMAYAVNGVRVNPKPLLE